MLTYLSLAQIPRLLADNVWPPPLSTRGSGVNIAVIDTGVDSHFDFGGRLGINQNFGMDSTHVPIEPSHHGTHVAGIIGAQQGNGDGIQGVAPSCILWNLKASSRFQDGNVVGYPFFTGDVIEALTYCRQNNAHVINMSFAGPVDIEAEAAALAECFNAGIVLVAGAGNTGQQETARFPAAHPGVIAISSIQENPNTLSSFSSFGTYIDFTAPGTNILSLAENTNYRVLSGTSMASPCFTGVVAALVVSAIGSVPPGCPPITPGAPKNQTVEKV